MLPSERAAFGPAYILAMLMNVSEAVDVSVLPLLFGAVDV